MTEFEKQQKIITDLYRRLGSKQNGDYVTVGFIGSGKTHSIVCSLVEGRKKVDSEFFNFNNVLNNFM